MYNFTDKEKSVLRSIVSSVRNGEIPDEFWVFFDINEKANLHWNGSEGFYRADTITSGALDALASERVIRCNID